MFQQYFGLKQDPFIKNHDPEDLYRTVGFDEMVARLMYLLDLRGIGLFTGEPGSGKTTAARAVVAKLHTGLYRILYVPLSTGNVMDMYKTIAWELGLPTERSRAALYKAIRTEVSRLCTESKLRPVLIVDEAHHLRSDVLEDLRLLTNYQMDSENRLCLVFVGHAELKRRLGMAVHEALAQRIVVNHHIGGMERHEMADYLTHLLRLAGAEAPLFTPPALETIYQATKGLPRKVNLLAQFALTAAANDKAKEVDQDHVRRAAHEII